MSGHPSTLTAAQRRHLTELAAIHDEHGAAFWTPIGSGEMRSASVLARLGLLRAHGVPHSRTQYELTPEGREAVR